MKNIKKFGLLFLLVVMITTLTACGGNEKNSSSNSSSLKTSELSIEDFKWETKASKCNGDDCYVLSLVNNSKFDVIVVNFSYKVKDDVSDSELSVYDEFMREHDGYIDEDDSPKDVTLIGSKDQLVEKGATLTDLRFTVGFQDYSWYDYPTDKQFELMEPRELELGIINNNKLYIAYYNFKEKSWKLDEKSASADTWSNKEIAKKISKPNEKHHVIITDDDDEFEIHSYGVTEDMYNEYIQALISAGFTKEDYNSHFEGTDSNGYEVEVWHYKEEQRLSISIEKQ